MQLTLTFSDHNGKLEPVQLRWQVQSHATARRWIALLQNALVQADRLESCFLGFPASEQHYQDICQRINSCIECIEAHGDYFIGQRAPDPYDVSVMAELQRHFENLMQLAYATPGYAKACPDSVLLAIKHLGDLVQELQAYANFDRRRRSFAGIEPVLLNRFARGMEALEAAPLALADRERFQTAVDFGTIVLHHSQVGFAWLDAFFAEQSGRPVQKIKAMQAMRADFDVFFYDLRLSAVVRRDFSQFLRRHGQNPHDPALALGFCPLARLETNVPRHEIYRQLSARRQVTEVKLHRPRRLIWPKTQRTRFTTNRPGLGEPTIQN